MPRMPRGQEPGRILVVDDDPTFGELMRDYLTGEGYAVEVCAHSAEAFERIWARPPGLVLLDIRMPQPTGLQLLDQLAADPATRSIPVLLCTACGPYEAPVWAEELGRRGAPVLFKPFPLAELGRRVPVMLAPQPAALSPATPVGLQRS